MSGGFSEAERERIRERLVDEGRELFSRYGLKKTTIADLTEPVGIATSTFYQFFESKEDLYVEILEREGEEMLPRLLAPFEEHDDPEAAIVGFLSRLMDEIESNPLIRRLLVEPQEMQLLRDYHTEEELREGREQSLAYFLPYVEAWYEAGAVRGPDPMVVASAIRSVSFLTLHQNDIGEDLYPETRDLVIRAVAKGLTE
ncbi:TetR/AcrR family transcriptional regulator [Haloarchaeobius sp. DT45]|uniref:TetR/AcrR family transcriptional regulator n=1 Tax=Haloarchaeobius sp. DT45 TaxID=3446116 RepID=UPI003F6B10A6